MSLTNEDKKWIVEQDNRVFQQLVAYVDHRLYSIEKKLEHMEKLPTKEEFYMMLDKMFNFSKKTEEKLDALIDIVARHEEEINSLKKYTNLNIMKV